jgi:hypothetical protein
VNGNRELVSQKSASVKIDPRRSWRLTRLVLPIAFVSATILLVFASVAAAGPSINGTTHIVPGTTALNAIACGSQDFCVAVGSDSGEGVVVPVTDGIPGTPEAVPVTDALTAVSCPNSTTCTAVGYGPYSNPPEPTATAGYVIDITNGSWSNYWVVPGNGEPDAPDQVHLYGVACPRPSWCLAGGTDVYLGVVVLAIHGGPGTLESVAPFGGVQGIACRSKGFCLAAGDVEYTKQAGAVFPIVDGKPQGEGDGAAGVGILDGVACRSTTWCVSVGSSKHGDEGAVTLIIDQSPSGPKFVSTATVLNGVACSSRQNECLTVGANNDGKGVAVGINDGTPGIAQVVRGTQGLSGVACPSSTACLVVGSNDSHQGVLATVPLSPH